MNKTYKYTLTANERKEITFGVGVNRLAISNANGTDGDITIVTSEITKTDSGEICSFVDGADAPFADFKVNIEAVQSGSGDPSPTNVRPISGWTGANIYKRGFNLWDEEWEVGSINAQTGLPTPSTTQIRSVNFCQCVPNTQYCKISTNTNLLNVFWYDAEQQFISVSSGGGAKPYTVVTSPTNARFFKIRTDNAYGTTYNNDISINYPATETNYHPHTGNTYNINWQSTAGTVYGGTLDVKTGELTVTHTIKNLSTLGWGESVQGNNKIFYATLSDRKISNPSAPICNTYKYVGTFSSASGFYNNSSNYDLGFNSESRTIYVRDENYTSASDFKSHLDTVVLVYELATHAIYQLTPTEVRSLLGINNVWADCGSIDIKYFVQSTQPLFDYINDEDDKCVYIDCEQTGQNTFSITSSITKAEFASLLNKNKNVKLRLDTGSDDIIFDLSYITANTVDFTYNRTAVISDVNSFQSMTLRVDMSGDTLSLSRHAVITIDDGSYEFVTGQNNQLIKDGWSWSTQGYDLSNADELLFMITPMPNVASDSNTIYGELQRSSQDPKRALFCKGIKNMLPEVQEIESPFWFNDIAVVGNRTAHTAKNDIIMKIRVWTRYYNLSDPSLADVNFYADCDCSDSTANLWGMCNIFVFKKKR